MATLPNNSGNQNQQGNHKAQGNKPSPEVRDNLDSRGDLEQRDNDMSHNTKEVHDGEKNEQNNPEGGPARK